MSMSKAFLVASAAFASTACSTNDFVASWRAPDAQPLEVQGAKVAAVVIVNNEASRRVADRGEIRTNTIMQVETLVYSLRQNKLAWGGQSRLTNPASIDRAIERLAASAADELHKQGLLR